MRWTAPMKAPSPPPTMPSLILAPVRASLRPSMVMALLPSLQSERALDLLLVDGGAGEIVERLLGDADDVLRDELGALAPPVFRVLETALPFQHRPGGIAVLRHLGENAGKIDLPVAERTEAPGPLDPRRIARIDALPSVRIELRVLDVERLDPLVVDVDELEIVELLQHEVRRIVVDRAALVALDRVEEALERRSVEQVLAGMELISDVAAGVVERVEDRRPAFGELLERRLDQARRALRPGIEKRPGERAGEGRMGGEAEALRRLGGLHHVFDRPFPPFRRLAPYLLRREGVECVVVSRIHGDELGGHVAGEFGDRQAVALGDAGDLVAIGLRLRRLVDVDEPVDPGRNLHALVAERGRPPAHAVERIERRRVADELIQENRRTLDVASHNRSFARCSARLSKVKRGRKRACARSRSRFA